MPVSQESAATDNAQTMSGAQAIVSSLENLGVTDVFGMPGGAILPTYDPLMDSSMRHILVRHEQCAGHAAEGYALATGNVGVCIATSGPGATNLVTALADANMDSVPMVAITGQVDARFIGTDAFQEADVVGVTMPVTKHNFLIKDPADIPGTLVAAFHIAQTGRPGPVVVDVTKSAQVGEFEFSWPPKFDLPGYNPSRRTDTSSLQEAAAAIVQAQRPVFYVGGGVARAGASKELRELVDIVGAPVTTTLTALDTFPSDDELNLGMPGMHGTVAAVGALQRCDLMIVVGARFDDRVTGRLDTFAPQAKVVHLDVDPAEISKNRTADYHILGDAKEILPQLSKACAAAINVHGHADLKGWFTHLNYLRKTYPLGYTEPTDGMLSPQYVIKRLGELSPKDTIFASGVGQHQMWSAQFLKFNQPRTWLSSSGLGTMGVAIPYAMGAQTAQPDRVVWAIDGDGCFQMTNQELATCMINRIPIKVAIINNSSLGMVRQWQNLFYSGRFSYTDLNTGTGTQQVPNFVMLAEAYGGVGLRAETEAEVDEVIKQALKINDRPVVIDFRVSRDAMVWPMVPAGVSNDQIMHARGLAPVWDEED